MLDKSHSSSGSAASLNTDSYINALRRFIARRGQVTKMRSNNGINFVGPEHELKITISEWYVSKIEDAMLHKISTGNLFHLLGLIMEASGKESLDLSEEF